MKSAQLQFSAPNKRIYLVNFSVAVLAFVGVGGIRLGDEMRYPLQLGMVEGSCLDFDRGSLISACCETCTYQDRDLYRSMMKSQSVSSASFSERQ